MSQDVFFIVGCVRSGTTLLRNLLKQHPNLMCPEETHIFRWADPFDSNDFKYKYNHGEVLKQHRQIDGVAEQDFKQIQTDSWDRKDFFINYLKAFKRVQGVSHKRCFDKTPQNIYGLPLIKAFFPKAKIIFIVRNPLNVVSSLLMGRGLNPQSLAGAINFWKESVLILNELRPILNDNLIEIHYEKLTQNPQAELQKLFVSLGEKAFEIKDITSQVHVYNDLYKQELQQKDIDKIVLELADWMDYYGYKA